MSIRKSDLLDADVVDSEELLSDGYFVYLTSSLVSTTFATKIITINLPSDSEGLITGLDHPAQSGDRVRLTGTSGASADGYFIIDAVLSDTTFSVTDIIASSTGGTIQFMYMPGARQVGFDPTGLTITNAHNVQDAIKDIAQRALTPEQHETLRQLIHFLDNGPGDGFASGAVRVTNPDGSPFPTQIIWYLDGTQTTKLVDKTIVYGSIPVPITITWNMYDFDGTTIIHTVVDTFTYTNNVFEKKRVRSIV